MLAQYLNPLFTIVIPTLNSGKNLAAALESIIGQTFQNFEVLILDGLSKDNTIQIARSYKHKWPNIKIYSATDKGIYDAMNTGIELARGDWIYFMGSDDKFYQEDVLELISVSKILNEVDVLYGNVYSTRFNGIYDGEFTYKKLAIKNICHQAIFFKKDVFKKVGAFNLKYTSHADYDHNIRWFFSSEIKNAFIDLVIADYADGGFSSLNPDKRFKKDKPFKLMKRGYGKLPTSVLLKIFKDYVLGRKYK